MTALALPTTPAFSPKVGELVMNFGQAGRVVSVEANGDLILKAVGGRMKWRACPAKCQPAR
jgi:hypothetical protein